PSGSGKSLFLRALADLDPHEGRMALDGVAAEVIPAHQWRRQVGLLPAESAWWFDSVGPHCDPWPLDALQYLGFSPDVLSWSVSRLSSGERQRLSLLRLLARSPRILLLDEPTANLDVQNTERVEQLLRDFRTKHRPGMLWISHDMAQLKRCCDTIYILEERRLSPLGAGYHDPAIALDR
ncbi:MAG: ATP-binding cassette domain-containing protein, partial [Desulfobacterales bacterium]|nr:ATP-binding cassette domain-containing protein [Desulfobacterales bacterium]